jgi:hypothetical protein
MPPRHLYTPANPLTCPHGLRPGTTVCLHCRHEARAANRQRLYRLGARIGLATVGVGVVVAGIVAGISTIASDARTDDRAPATAKADSTPKRPLSAVQRPRPSGLAPIVAEGRSELGDSVVAERSGNTVTVYFDTETLRTRLAWKFEAVVRSTLPTVFGPEARAALDAVPSGTFVLGDLLRELPTRGVPLALSGRGATITVFPVTRPGRDGPLVVAYRATLAR